MSSERIAPMTLEKEDLSTPRLVYKGKQDVLGQGVHTDPETGELVGETKVVNTPEELAQAKKDGWRLTAEDPDAAEPTAVPKKSADPDYGAPKAKK
jgi:hypothetical protein